MTSTTFTPQAVSDRPAQIWQGEDGHWAMKAPLIGGHCYTHCQTEAEAKKLADFWNRGYQHARALLASHPQPRLDEARLAQQADGEMLAQLIEKEGIAVGPARMANAYQDMLGEPWRAYKTTGHCAGSADGDSYGATPLIAAQRCYEFHKKHAGRAALVSPLPASQGERQVGTIGHIAPPGFGSVTEALGTAALPAVSPDEEDGVSEEERIRREVFNSGGRD